MEPVSYTHLDVYKRQTEMPSDSGEKDTSNMKGSVVSTQIPVGVVVHTAADTCLLYTSYIYAAQKDRLLSA